MDCQQLVPTSIDLIPPTRLSFHFPFSQGNNHRQSNRMSQVTEIVKLHQSHSLWIRWKHQQICGCADL